MKKIKTPFPPAEMLKIVNAAVRWNDPTNDLRSICDAQLQEAIDRAQAKAKKAAK